jgi:hypothetical protein
MKIQACLLNPGINLKLKNKSQGIYKEDVTVVETPLNRDPVSFFMTKKVGKPRGFKGMIPSKPRPVQSFAADCTPK